jgi:hypothetical protein
MPQNIKVWLATAALFSINVGAYYGGQYDALHARCLVVKERVYVSNPKN